MKLLAEHESYCLGMSLTVEALKNRPDCLNRIVISSKASRNEQLENMLKMADEHHIEVITDDRLIEKYSLKENCYCIGFFIRFESKTKSDRHIVLYEFDDFGQLGTVLRSAVSFDFNDVVLINTEIDYFDPRAIRASMGAVFHLNIQKYSTLEEYYRDYPYNSYLFLDKAEKELHALNPVKPYSLIIPNDETKLNEIKENTFYVKHIKGALPLSALASVVFNYCFEKR